MVAKYNLNSKIFCIFQLDSCRFQPESSRIPGFQPESAESGQNQWRNGKYWHGASCPWVGPLLCPWVLSVMGTGWSFCLWVMSFVGAQSLSMGAGSLFVGPGLSIVGGGARSCGRVVCGRWFVICGCSGDVLCAGWGDVSRAGWSPLARWDGIKVALLTKQQR